jgi:hypothetical protein
MKIKQGDSFLCIKDFVMNEGNIAYTKGKEYKSQLSMCITDNGHDPYHKMESVEDFNEYFTKQNK